MKKPMKLKKIIKYFDGLSNVIIWLEDEYNDEEEPEEPIYEGLVMDIPWYILDFYLSNTEGGESIAARNWGEEYDNTCGFIINVREKIKERKE